MPTSVSEFMNALSPPLLDVFPNIVVLAGDTDITHYNDDSNALFLNYGFNKHPLLERKSFLINFGNLPIVYLICLLAYPAFLVISQKLTVFEKYAKKFWWNAFIRIGYITFFELLLICCIQLKNFNIGNNSFYTASSAFSIIFIVFFVI